MDLSRASVSELIEALGHGDRSLRQGAGRARDGRVAEAPPEFLLEIHDRDHRRAARTRISAESDTELHNFCLVNKIPIEGV